ncbi:hypothetical protein EDB85DRAFT_2157407 [Lactarius pseudohatsudake]|nr:hypothetical protein EDB85DRAFT_2157407 [Lactarius pseudohatsudake]
MHDPPHEPHVHDTTTTHPPFPLLDLWYEAIRPAPHSRDETAVTSPEVENLPQVPREEDARLIQEARYVSSSGSHSSAPQDGSDDDDISPQTLTLKTTTEHPTAAAVQPAPGPQGDNNAPESAMTSLRAPEPSSGSGDGASHGVSRRRRRRHQKPQRQRHQPPPPLASAPPALPIPPKPVNVVSKDPSFTAATISSGPQPASIRSGTSLLPDAYPLHSPHQRRGRHPPPMLRARCAPQIKWKATRTTSLLRNASEHVAKLPGGQYYPEQDWINMHSHPISLQVQLPSNVSSPEWKIVTVSPSPARDSPRDYTPIADIPFVESANTPEDPWWDWQAEEDPRVQERVWAAIEALEDTARTGRLVSDRSPSPPQTRYQEPWE